ncbi:hypothetical protein GCM10011273_35120 [Asticcacaulis endophyticus]|uniref:DUF4411 family protein n=1 Tax=Asticcacaulis endophyticus TaxID=1395890 RepID=A0A918QF13_9CAUL|nr:hypothetical protein GCM10011273_35120 [Asticcacaulis endophyticus]
MGAWAKQKHVREALELVESVDLNALQQVFDQGYGTYLTDADYEKMGKDPFLIAYALSKGYTVITKETPKPSAQKGNRKVPDVCNSVGVTWARDFPIFKALGFKIT